MNFIHFILWIILFFVYIRNNFLFLTTGTGNSVIYIKGIYPYDFYNNKNDIIKKIIGE